MLAVIPVGGRICKEVLKCACALRGATSVGWAMPILEDRERISEGFKKLRPSTYQWALWMGAVFIEVHIQKDTN